VNGRERVGYKKSTFDVNIFWKYVYFGCNSHHAANRHCFVGKRPVKISTDKVKLASVAKKLFFWKITRPDMVHRPRKKV